MDFNFTPDQMALQKMVRDFVAKEITPKALEMDKEGEVPPELWTKLDEAGLLNLTVPAEYDGPGLDALSIALIYEELGKGCAGIATTTAANALASYPLVLLGTDEQKKKVFDVLNDGKLAAFALTEPGAGSDAGAVATSAVKDGDYYILNGTKCFITNGGIADIYIIFANTRKSAGIRGLTAFIIDRDTPGFSVGKEEEKMGIRASNTCELILDNVRIPASNRIGKEGEGFKIAMKTLDAARPFVGAVSVGLSQTALDLAVKYSKERVQFDKPIASFQLVQAMIADMAMAVEAARLLVYKACWLKDQGLPYSKESAMAKCFAADTAMKVTTDAVQVLGGYGYSKEYPAEKYMRDAKIMQIYEGTNQIQRLVIANNILY
ncbi:MAG TPA: acyl-CoA dehydrogenase family protein [Methylomusa anaerophila]|uniref:Acyl-CoA dehydrogenase n=1 Tax=Methylomusa anaerophila TaxID=1930071 RepID=A0A348AP26_9FIRM|nr:acyl-CoA dehydrogenase family protein [Methylomusa anaerophila]BBB92824.1 acyl-CoA dehydrogenase [Methylomusa anaerophila]HML87336.1 acyl-CoA dehydrogenase family protein [Methylomusa anaerophila]